MKKITAIVIFCFIGGYIPFMTITAAANSIKEQVKIQDVSVSGTKGSYLIKGMAFSEDTIYYTVEDGHNELITKKTLPVKNHTFSLKLQLDEKNLPINGTLTLYFSEEGKEPYSIVLETFS